MPVFTGIRQTLKGNMTKPADPYNPNFFHGDESNTKLQDKSPQ